MTEKMVDIELVKLTKRPPRTTAEKEFHKWLLSWREKLTTVQKASA
jgi:hypothetical protein